MSKLEKGQILEGTVKNITSYGVFVDLGGVDGLIPVSYTHLGKEFGAIVQYPAANGAVRDYADFTAAAHAVGFKISTKPMAPKLSKFNPINGFKRIA